MVNCHSLSEIVEALLMELLTAALVFQDSVTFEHIQHPFPLDSVDIIATPCSFSFSLKLFYGIPTPAPS